MITIFSVILLATYSNGFPKGAPTSVCQSMMVVHKNTTQQRTPSPFEVTALRNDKETLVFIKSDKNVQFEGLMLQARTSTGEPTGTFVPLDDNLLHTIQCQQPGDTITHSNTQLKASAEIRWIPSDGYTGPVIFNATVAADYRTFWVGVESAALQVGDGSSQTDGFYDGCAAIKFCFGIPDGCVESKNCTATVAVRAAEKYEFEMQAIGNSAWVAVGLSEDTVMGDDSVLECVKDGTKISAYKSWNTPRPNLNTVRLPNPQDGIRLIKGRCADNSMYCKVLHDSKTNTHDREFDLSTGLYHIFVASGSRLRENAVGYHNLGQISSRTKRYLSDTTSVGGTSKILLKLHGVLMVIAWLCTSSLGTFIARHYRKTWVGKTMCGKDIWFQWHRIFMTATCILTVIGFILVWVELNGWMADHLHSICGCVVTTLCFLESVGAVVFRPPLNSPNRPVFNWIHWFVGNATHIIAIITIFLATNLQKAELPEMFVYILAVFAVFHFFTNFILAVMGHLSNTSSSKVTALSKNNSTTTAAVMVNKMTDVDEPYSGLRKILMLLYTLGVCSLTITLNVIILDPIL